MPKVVITSLTMPIEDDDSSLQRLRDAGWTVVISPWRSDRTDVDMGQELHDADAVIAGSDPFTEKTFAIAGRLKLIARVGVGYDAIDVEAASRHGVSVTLTIGSNHEAVADSAMSLIMALGRRVIENHQEVKAGGWQRSIGVDVWKKTIGIVGTGLIGSAVARRASGFDMRILAYDVVPSQTLQERYSARYVSLDVLLRESDYVTLHVALNPHTRHMIGAPQLAQMKTTAYLINTCRGPVIDEAALNEALRSGTIAGAGLDVFEREPPVGSPLLSLPNVVLGPHVAGISVESARAMADAACDEVLRLGRGEPLVHAVNAAAFASR